MTQLPLFQRQFWTITEITRYLREMFEDDSNLQDIWVQGEVSNCSQPRSGHFYFTLKDAACSLKGVMWRTQASRQAYIPKDGDAVEVHGSIDIYEAGGQYQLYADLIRPGGEGQLYREYLRLKARLEAEGLFEQERKREIPRWPHTIGIVTSPTGAALRDMLNTIRRRYALAVVVLSPTPVQGEEAPPGIVAALRAANRVARPDVILVARGGGSMEDLWAFNDERVARAICESAAPVICGVGHETDFTIADFVCDLRAPTPTAAAELATPDRMDLAADLDDVTLRMGRAMQACLNAQRWNINRLENRLLLRSPRGRIRSDRQRLDELDRRMAVGLDHDLKVQRLRLHGLEQRLKALNPLAVLGRGYALVTRPDGQVVTAAKAIRAGDELDLRFADGSARVQAAPEGEGEG